jgi:N-methylhydantoinase A
MSATTQKARIGIDIGGTFTDFALEIGGRRHTAKVLTTPSQPEKAVLDGLASVLREANLSAVDVGIIIHGTTLATNALIERRGANTALITTEGFRDVLESGTENRYEQYDLAIDLPKPLVPRRRRFTVPERIDAQGRIRRPLDPAAVTALVPKLVEANIEAIAVGLLHSYINPVHEATVGKLLEKALPHVPVTLSSTVSPEMREYERFSTACANAYIQPKIAAYLVGLETGLAALGINCPILLMLSSGGLTTLETASRFPVRLVESGPAGGAIFSSHVARQCGFDKVVSFDMGGTTAKVCLIDNFQPQTSRTFEVARIYRFKKGSGLPLRIPVIEMVEIGAGGGSMAYVDQMSRISVGPESAGSEPGPACYGRGGTMPTVTDADAVLGRIDPAAFAGGKMVLDVEASKSAITAELGQRLNLSSEIAAFGVSEVVDENMANAARVHAIESGKDVAERTLIAFGGAAPLHTARVAEKLGIKSFVIPAGAGVGSAIGFLRAPVSYELVHSFHQPLESFDPARANALLDSMAAEARTVVEPAAAGRELREQRTVFMRYVGQGHEIAVPVQNGTLSASAIEALQAAFLAEYSRLYGRVVPFMAIELLTWIVRVWADVDPAETTTMPETKPYLPHPTGTRRVFDAEQGKWETVPVFQRGLLHPGAEFPGPAIVVEDETTTIVTGKFNARVNGFGFLECARIDAR